jgi:hypothetical protein
MRRENSHRRRGVYRARAGGWGHRAVYVGAAVATAALLAGFGAAILVYGPLGQPTRQIGGSTLNVPPRGVSFGPAGIVFANALSSNNSTLNGGAIGLNLTWNETGGVSNGPCNTTGVWDNGTQFNATNVSQPWNLTGHVALVCLNAVSHGNITATWYNGTAGQGLIYNNYTSGGVVNGSYYTGYGAVNISSCSNWSLFHNINTTYGSYIPCQTYFEMNANTTYLPSFNGTNNAGPNSTESLWSPGQNGYASDDLVYVIPVYFANTSANATYEITIAAAGITPVAQTFFFNNTAPGENSTVLFAFDMTAAWLMDLTVTNETPFHSTSQAIYASVGVVSSIVTECGLANGYAVCPVISKT